MLIRKSVRIYTADLKLLRARSASLQRFLDAYRKLAQMPAPNLKHVPLAPLVARVAALETRLNVGVQTGPDITFSVDTDQLEQMLINLIRNAADAVSPTMALIPTGSLQTERVCWSGGMQMRRRSRWKWKMRDPDYLIHPISSLRSTRRSRMEVESAWSFAGKLPRHTKEASKLAIEPEGSGCLVKIVLPIHMTRFEGQQFPARRVV